MIKIFHRFNPSEHRATLKPAALRERAIAQLIDSIILSATCSVIILLFSGGKIYTTWVAPIIPQFLLEVGRSVQPNIANFWWGGHFFSIHLPYGKDIFMHYPAPLLWVAYCLYYTAFTFFTGQTPGKMMKRLVILNNSEGSLSILKSFLRWGAYYISFISLGLGFWWRDIGKDQKTWHDKICKTQVYQF